MSEQCYTCSNPIDDLETASRFLDTEENQHFQCPSCMDGSHCFTCEFCGNGIASERVDYVPSGYREYWCEGCTAGVSKITKISGGKYNNRWLLEEDVSIHFLTIRE